GRMKRWLASPIRANVFLEINMQLILHRLPRDEQLAFNRQRWAELLDDAELARHEFRIETNGAGQILMTPPAAGDHSNRQSVIILTIHNLLGGHPLPECPISTQDGVRAADVGWYSDHRYEQVRGQIAFETAPEIGVEVISPRNTATEMNDKRQLYFDAGALEVWFCNIDGRMEFYEAKNPTEAISHSNLCPEFPVEISPT
ncbi:MAG: Uma2 family endonuclease, partial [Pirellulaceae bacterium]